jgi:hypothetical protein
MNDPAKALKKASRLLSKNNQEEAQTDTKTNDVEQSHDTKTNDLERAQTKDNTEEVKTEETAVQAIQEPVQDVKTETVVQNVSNDTVQDKHDTVLPGAVSEVLPEKDAPETKNIVQSLYSWFVPTSNEN